MQRARGLLTELQKEVALGHSLFGRAAKAVATRKDCDDVLFETDDPEKPLAVVHLTWKESAEIESRWPATRLFAGWDVWV